MDQTGHTLDEIEPTIGLIVQKILSTTNNLDINSTYVDLFEGMCRTGAEVSNYNSITVSTLL